MGFDLIIKNGRIIDGTGNPWYRGDMGITGDRIAAIGSLPPDAAKVIDASGHVVSPGFVDMHTHSDLTVFEDPTFPAKVLQGVTLDVLTQDGFSAAPVNAETRPVWRKMIAGIDGDPPVEWSWESLGQFMDAIQAAGPGINVATLVPYGNVRSMVLGFGAEQPNAQQTEQMKAIVAQGMAEGAVGMSLGLIYQPQMYTTLEELAEVFVPVGESDGMMMVHIRNEGDLLLEAFDEVAEACRRAGCALHISHTKTAGRQNWEKGLLLLKRMEEERARGLQVTFDQYPYTAGSTFLHACLPPWATQGGVERMVERLRDPGQRELIQWQIEHLVGADRPTNDPSLKFWENFVGSAGWEGIMITSVKTERNKPVEGKLISDLAKAAGKSPADFVFDLLIEEECAASMAAFISSEENVKHFLAHEYGTLGSDGIPTGKPHPRQFGTFPRALGTYVREHGVLSLPQMVRRMTSLPCQILGFHDRGILKPGMKADITIFDPDRIGDTATFADPRQHPVGIQAVVVNGVVAVEDGKLTGARNGKVLRRR